MRATSLTRESSMTKAKIRAPRDAVRVTANLDEIDVLIA